MEILGAATTILAGLAFLLFVYGNLSYERQRRSRGVVVQGRIVGAEWDMNTASAVYQAPVVEFVDREGRTRRFQQRSGTTFRPDVGSTVEVWYDPERPDDKPVLHEDRPTKLFPVIFGLLGVVLVGVGGVLLAVAVQG